MAKYVTTYCKKCGKETTHKIGTEDFWGLEGVWRILGAILLLISFIPMSIVALILHFKNKLVKFKETYWLAIIGAVVSIISALIAVNINNNILKKIFAIFLLGIGVWQIVEIFKQKKED